MSCFVYLLYCWPVVWAFSAASSASSLPCVFECPGTHNNVMCIPFFRSSWVQLLIFCIMVELIYVFLSAVKTLSESVIILNLLLLFVIDFMCFNALNIAVASAEKLDMIGSNLNL